MDFRCVTRGCWRSRDGAWMLERVESTEDPFWGANAAGVGDWVATHQDGDRQGAGTEDDPVVETTFARLRARVEEIERNCTDR